jgi:multifunctional beta-oxidation protein
VENFGNLSGGGSDESSGSSYEDPEDTPEIKEAKKNAPAPEDFSYTERDVTLYNLGVGAKADELQWVYENADDFAVSRLGTVHGFANRAVLMSVRHFRLSV